MSNVFGRNKSLKFRTTAHREKRNRRKLIILFSIVFTIIFVASLVTFINERSKPIESDDEESEITYVADNLKEEVSILFVGASTNENTPLFASVITLNTKTKVFTIVCFDPNLGVDASKGDKLVAAVETKYNTEIDRYCIVTQEQFKPFITAMGKYNVNIKETINYSDSEYTLSLLPGQQTLNCDNFFKYIRYMATSGTDSAYKAQAGVIGDYISQKLNETNSAKGQDLYESLVNNSSSDIKPDDYLRYQTLLDEISAEPRNIETAGTKFLEK